MKRPWAKFFVNKDFKSSSLFLSDVLKQIAHKEVA